MKFSREIFSPGCYSARPVARMWMSWPRTGRRFIWFLLRADASGAALANLVLAWGITPIDNTMPDEYIQREQLTEVRVIVEDNFPDALHSILYNVIIRSDWCPQTVVLQGSRQPATRP